MVRKIWRGIWSLKVPNKVKHFTWKACRNILATKENLWRRKVTQDGLCEECGDTMESALHILWFCKQAQAVWTHSKLVLPFTISQSWEFIDLVGQLLQWKDAYPDIMERAMMICWGIWRKGNEVKHGGKRKTAPKQGQYKVNCDAAVFAKSREVGFGVNIRDYAGLVDAALSKKGFGLTGVVEAEAKAMEVAVQFAKDVGIREATFEGDSLIVSRAIQGTGDVPASIQNIVCGITQKFQCFRTAEVSHLKRQENAPAHLLAQHAVHVVDFFTWLEECPSFIEHACAHDVIRISSV
ncbi:uncharacterized protein LOC142635234 [Castanea sativa]|uniref:uncharacterized protein LOC142635234 n=1 Tax=Castanea sativa TaxID=21020 RepID=UPI003F64CE98